MSENDWLNPGVEEQRQEQVRKGLEIADLYRIFEDTERGRQLLEFWEKQCLHKRTPVDAPVQQYAADEAVRGFVAGIKHQLELARQHKQ